MSRRRKKKAARSEARFEARSDARSDAVRDEYRLDGWANLATGLGYSRDKRTWGSFLDVEILDDDQLENLYAGDDLAARIVDHLPEHAMRGGFEIRYEGESDDVTDLQRAIEQKIREVETTERVTNALCWGRLYGGGALLLGADDGVADAAVPLDDTRVRDLRFLNDLERRDLSPLYWYDDPREQGYGEPEIYQLTPHGYSRSGGVEVTTIHESRLIETYGSRTPRRYRQRNHGWTLSVLQRVHEVIRDFEQAFGSVGNMLLDCSQGVLSQKGLIRSIGAIGAAAIEARMASIDTYRSSNRMLVLDADGETFQHIERTFAGVDAMLALFMLRVSSAARISVTKLFGRSPAGLNATGESDLENDYAEVMSYQEQTVQPILDRIVRLAATSLGSPDPESWSVAFPSLWIEGPRAIAERAKLVGDRDVAYIAAQVYEPEEVALARAQGVDAEIVIDEDVRRRQLEMDTERAWEEPDPELGAAPGDGAAPPFGEDEAPGDEGDSGAE